MFLSVISPQGQVSSLDLGALEVWRMELYAYASNPDEPESKNMLAIAFRYVTLGQVATQTVVAVDCKATNELAGVVKIGMSAGGREGDKSRMREALKVLHNAISDSETKQVLAQVDMLVDIYYNLMGALFGQRPQALASMDAILKGELRAPGADTGWRFALTKMRDQPWLPAPTRADDGESSGLGPSPGMGAALPAAQGAGRKGRGGKKSEAALGALPPPPSDGDLKPTP